VLVIRKCEMILTVSIEIKADCLRVL